MNYLSVQTFLAQGLTNPAISGSFGTGGVNGSTFALARLIATTWRVFLTLGALAVLVFMAWGAMGWITSGGDKGQVEAARNRITAAIIGMIVLFSMFALTAYIFPRIGFNILNPSIPDNLNNGTTTP